MKKILLPFFVCLVCVGVTHAQDYNTEVNFERDDKKIDVTLKTTYQGTMSLFIEFEGLQNARYTNFTPITMYRPGKVFTLNPIKEDEYINYNVVRYVFSFGRIDTKINTDYLYRLPFSLSKQAEVTNLIDLEDYYNDRTKGETMGYGFTLSKGDTLYCTRPGKVVRIVKEGLEGGNIPQSGVEYTSKRNHIIVEHSDGSFALYSPIANNGFLVREGDMIQSGAPIGIVGTFDGELYQGRLAIYHMVKNPDYNPRDTKSKITRDAYLVPRFATTQGATTLEPTESYTPATDAYIQTQDLSKSQLKKWSKANGVPISEIEACSKRWK